MQICKRTKAKVWQETETPIEKPALELAFATALDTGSSTEFFDSIYIPVKKPTNSGMPESWSWENIGLDSEEIAKVYADFYGENYIIEPLVKRQNEPYDYIGSCGLLANRIKSVLEMNKGKYLKLIELNGYTYNPIWNVDGEEIYTSLENEGSTTEKTETGADSVTFSSVDSTQQTDLNTYEGGSAHPAQTVTTTANPALDANGKPTKNYTRTRAEPEDNTIEKTYTHETVTTAEGAEYTAAAEDTAFNQAAVGADKYHTDKRIRRGNIGVTATQDLIEKQKAIVRTSILQEFFDDINQQILIGIFDF